jgi:hypothetical protein
LTEIYLLRQTFFSLTPSEAAEYRANLFSQIHEIVFHGNGGYNYMTIYNMPIWLRNFTFKKIEKHFNDLKNQNSGTSTNDINQAKEILTKAQKQDPRNKKFQPQEHPKVKVPDFVTQTPKPLPTSKLSKKS